MKVAVSTPLRDKPEPLYSECLEALRAHTVRERPDIELIYGSVRGPDLCNNRNRLANGALLNGAEWQLLIDGDMTFPPDALLRLLAHGVDIVGCNSARRSRPTYPTACLSPHPGKRELIWTTAERAADPSLEAVHALGLGVCLIRARVFEAVPRPWFAKDEGLSEDYNFFRKAGNAGYEVWLDHSLSWEIGHIDNGRIILNAHTVADRSAYLRLRETVRRAVTERPGIR